MIVVLSFFLEVNNFVLYFLVLYIIFFSWWCDKLSFWCKWRNITSISAWRVKFLTFFLVQANSRDTCWWDGAWWVIGPLGKKSVKGGSIWSLTWKNPCLIGCRKNHTEYCLFSIPLWRESISPLGGCSTVDTSKLGTWICYMGSSYERCMYL